MIPKSGNRFPDKIMRIKEGTPAGWKGVKQAVSKAKRWRKEGDRGVRGS
jgi:hypothetical protein